MCVRTLTCSRVLELGIYFLLQLHHAQGQHQLGRVRARQHRKVADELPQPVLEALHRLLDLLTWQLSMTQGAHGIAMAGYL